MRCAKRATQRSLDRETLVTLARDAILDHLRSHLREHVVGDGSKALGNLLLSATALGHGMERNDKATANTRRRHLRVTVQLSPDFAHADHDVPIEPGRYHHFAAIDDLLVTQNDHCSLAEPRLSQTLAGSDQARRGPLFDVKRGARGIMQQDRPAAEGLSAPTRAVG